MPRRDAIHAQVRAALINDGWQIIADPYRIVYKDATLEADMKADKLLVATRDKQSIIIEVKSFLQPSFIHEFLAACGQYQAYKYLLEEKGQTETIYMAIITRSISDNSGAKQYRKLVERFDIRLLVVDIEKEEITQWVE